MSKIRLKQPKKVKIAAPPKEESSSTIITDVEDMLKKLDLRFED
jgi:hypothetical protein